MMIEGCRTLITGASGGIGTALIKILSVLDCRIGYHVRDSSRVNSDLKSISGNNISILQKEFSCSKDSIDLVEEFCSVWGGIDALVQLHGDASSRQIDELSDSDWQDTLHTNLVSPFFLSRTAMKIMNGNSHGGRIVLTSTASAKHGGGSDTIPYGVAKAGIECLVKSLAKEGAANNILVNAIAPGFIDTTFHTHRLKKSEKQLAERKKMIPLNRAGTPNEVAQTILFLLSQASTFITGQTIEISGGDWL